MRNVPLIILGTAVAALACGPARAGLFSDVVVFGDSLSDTGNAHLGALAQGLTDPTPSSLGYYNGRFSDGEEYIDYLHRQLVGGPSNPYAPILFGLPAPGGLNFAIGGSRVVTNADPSLDLPAQLNFYKQYLTARSAGADPNALYVINAGSNDVRAQIEGTADAPTNTQVASGLVSAVTQLYTAGAQHVLLMNVGNLGAEPVFSSVAATARTASQATDTAINTALDTALHSAFGVSSVTSTGTYKLAPGKSFSYFDTLGWGDAVLANPGNYGLPANLDAQHPCFNGFSAPASCAGFAWADAIHPSSSLHHVLGQSVLPLVQQQAAYATASIGGTSLPGGALTSANALATKSDFNTPGCGMPSQLAVVGLSTGVSVASGSTLNVRRAPTGVSNCYLSVGFGSLTFDFGHIIDYAGLYMGSIDEYNSISFFANSGTTGVLGAPISFGSLGTVLDGSALASMFGFGLYTGQYLNFDFTALQNARYIQIGSTNTAAEVGEIAWHAVGDPAPMAMARAARVPTPASAGLLAGGLALVLASRRSRKRR